MKGWVYVFFFVVCVACVLFLVSRGLPRLPDCPDGSVAIQGHCVVEALP